MLKNVIRKMLTWVVLTPLSTLIYLIVIRLTHFYQGHAHDGCKKTILVLNYERYQHDLESLALDSRIRLLILPSRVQTALNSLFLDSRYSYEVGSYVQPEPKVEKLVNFVSGLIIALDKKYNLCAVLTCSFYYRQDMPYQFSAIKTKVPFYVLFKEYMKDDCLVDMTIKKYTQRRFKFYGDTIFCANLNIKNILLKAGVCNDGQISIVGSPRFDSVLRDHDIVNNTSQKIVTLFSFFHSSGGLHVNDDPIEGNFFTDDKNLGFYNLFEQVHVAIAELAVENSDVVYYIKTKWAGPWHEKIISTVFRNSGIDIRKQHNVILDYQENAQSLIKRSAVVVSFNSTTLLEASLLKTNVILPIFCEARTKYLDTNVLYAQYLDLLTTASSKEDLKDKIQILTTEQGYNEVPDQMIRTFLHVNDGKSGERIVDEFLR